MSRPALSLQIKALEVELKVKLWIETVRALPLPRPDESSGIHQTDDYNPSVETETAATAFFSTTTYLSC